MLKAGLLNGLTAQWVESPVSVIYINVCATGPTVEHFYGNGPGGGALLLSRHRCPIYFPHLLAFRVYEFEIVVLIQENSKLFFFL